MVSFRVEITAETDSRDVLEDLVSILELMVPFMVDNVLISSEVLDARGNTQIPSTGSSE